MQLYNTHVDSKKEISRDLCFMALLISERGIYFLSISTKKLNIVISRAFDNYEELLIVPNQLTDPFILDM